MKGCLDERTGCRDGGCAAEGAESCAFSSRGRGSVLAFLQSKGCTVHGVAISAAGVGRCKTRKLGMAGQPAAVPPPDNDGKPAGRSRASGTGAA